MIIWRGRGILVLVIGFGVLVLGQIVTDGMFGKGYYTANGWPKIVAGLIGAIPIWFLGKKWNDESDRRHELFFIPMQYWAFVLLALNLWVAVSPGDPEPQPAVTESAAVSAPAPASTPAPTPEPVRVEPEPAPAPVTKAAVVPPPPAADTSGRPAVQMAKVRFVYADNATSTYYPEDCAGRPKNAFRIARSLAVSQGFTLAAGCSEER